MTWGNVVSGVGALITLYGVARGLGPHGGVRELIPDRTRSALTWFRRRRNRDAEVLSPVALGGGAALAGRVTITAEGMVLPNPVTNTDAFIAALGNQFGTVSRQVGQVSDEIRAGQAALNRERIDREVADEALRSTLDVAVADVVARVKRLDLSGLRWQFIGAATVVVGIVVDGILG